jgi:hypothetical protein
LHSSIVRQGTSYLVKLSSRAVTVLSLACYDCQLATYNRLKII